MNQPTVLPATRSPLSTPACPHRLEWSGPSAEHSSQSSRTRREDTTVIASAPVPVFSSAFVPFRNLSCLDPVLPRH